MITEKRSVSFGVNHADLNTVGYQLRGTARTTAGVAEITAGSGDYGASITRDETEIGWLLWDTGGATPAYAAEELNPDTALTRWKLVNFGAEHGSLATVGYKFGAGDRTQSGVIELAPGSGIYGAPIPFEAGDDDYLIWDTGEVSPIYAVESITIPSVPGPTAEPTTDADFIEGLIHTVAVEIDVNAATTTTDAEGDRSEDWQPVNGLGALQCRVMPKEPRNQDLGDRPSALLRWRVLFGQSVVLDRRHRLVYMDPDNGAARYGFIMGRTVNAHGMNFYWYANALEYPI